ncbi:MAG: hypothetical protein WAX04_04990 [Oscillospiraceae bacterium]
MKTEKPFIQLFHTPNSGYFFDVNKNEIVKVDEDVFNYLYCVMRSEEVSINDATVAKVDYLEKNGYLSSNKVKVIRHSLTDYVETMLDRSMKKITIQLTQNCNFRCTYCPYSQGKGTQRNYTQKSMNLDLAKKAVVTL